MQKINADFNACLIFAKKLGIYNYYNVYKYYKNYILQGPTPCGNYTIYFVKEN
jgi:hypothetical protein